MEPVFMIDTIHDLPVHNEFRTGYSKANTAHNLLWILTALILLLYMTQFDQPLFVFCFLFLAAVHLVIYLLRKRKGGDIYYKRMLMANNGQPQHLVIELREDGILSTEQATGNHFRFAYDTVKSIIETKNLLLLVLPHRSCLILQKTWVKGGSVEELTAFLFQKCPNIKRKKLRKTGFGTFAQGLLAAVLIIGSIYAVFCLPGVTLLDKLPGKLHNDMTYTQIAEELEKLDIYITDQTIRELEAYDAEYLRENGIEYYKDYPDFGKAMDVLCWEGGGIYDEHTWEWTPSRSGVYWFDTEVWNMSAIYTDFLTGLSAMDESLVVSNVTEDYSTADIDNGTGSVTVSFDLNGAHHEIAAEYQGDWFDTGFLLRICQILEKDKEAENLYFYFDDQAILLYYGTGSQVRQLEWKTGVRFYSSFQFSMGF